MCMVIKQLSARDPVGTGPGEQPLTIEKLHAFPLTRHFADDPIDAAVGAEAKTV